jgi:hypothetical protein
MAETGGVAPTVAAAPLGADCHGEREEDGEDGRRADGRNEGDGPCRRG